jgi:hypothetical protein
MKDNEERTIQLVIPHIIYNDDKLSGYAKLILAEIFNLLKVERQHCWASNNHFAEMFNITRREAIYHFQLIEKEGWIISKAYNKCTLDFCHLKNKGWHRHIIVGDKLAKIFDALVQKRTSPLVQKTYYPSTTPRYTPSTIVGTISNTLEKNIENNERVEKIKKEIRNKIKRFK